jgi:hypothetical protein
VLARASASRAACTRFADCCRCMLHFSMLGRRLASAVLRVCVLCSVACSVQLPAEGKQVPAVVRERFHSCVGGRGDSAAVPGRRLVPAGSAYAQIHTALHSIRLLHLEKALQFATEGTAVGQW